jgi:hypothetical protein
MPLVNRLGPSGDARESAASPALIAEAGGIVCGAIISYHDDDAWHPYRRKKIVAG